MTAGAGEPARPDAVAGWLAALERRCLRDLTIAEIRRALQALSVLYVQKRGSALQTGRALESRGKRVAFAMFYGPIHFLLLRGIVRGLGGARAQEIVDLGCGTGVASAAWAIEMGSPFPRIVGVDRNGWALGEARWTWERLGLRGRALRRDVEHVDVPAAGAGVVAAFTLNELADEARTRLLERLVTAGRGHVLVVEPLAGRVAPWWSQWRQAVVERGGREDVWRFAVELPAFVRLLDRAAGLDHATLAARSLWM